MRRIIFLFLCSLACTNLSARAQQVSSSPSPIINDLKMLTTFELGMGKLLNDKQTVKPSTILKQLKSEPRLKQPFRFAPPGTRRLEPADIYNLRLASTVLVGDIAKCGECPLNHGDMAGGVAIASNLVLTAYHVIDSGDVLAQGVMSFDGVVRPIRRIVAADEDSDLAVVQTDGPPLRPAPVSGGDRVGEAVIALSHPAGRYYMLTEGRIARFTRYPLDEDKPQKGSYEAMEITADFAWGASGGPVYNLRGEVCGIIVTTESIYYEQTRKRQTDLQMVIKACAPVRAIRSLLKPVATP